MTMRSIHVRCLFSIAALTVVAGCSSASNWREDASRTPAPPGGERNSAVADEPRRVPDVISRPRPFRLADAAAQQVAAEQPRPEALPAVGQASAATAPRRFAGAQPAATRKADQHPAAHDIRAMMRDYLRAFNRHDAAALAAHWSPAGENHDLDSGVVTAAGREAVRDVFSALFHDDDEAVIDIELTSVRPLKDDVALVEGISTISFAEGPPAGSRFSAVVVKHDGRWLLEHVRESARRVPEGETARRHLDDLAWLVGSWEDEGAGVTASTRCDWAGNRSYLVRTHVVSLDRQGETPRSEAGPGIPGLLPAGSQKPREVMEVIGWDPDSRALRSWYFAGDGRFAEGTWSRNGAGWTVNVTGRGRDEGCTAMLTIEPHDGDGLAVRGDPGRLTNLLPPACSFGRTAR
ncbi:MAG: YybH family protein [Planctomycetia bacterium]|jgi:uncharacterized protein (TIGR02246 family)